MTALVAGLLCVAAVTVLLLVLRRLARPRRRMYAAISAECAAVQARAAGRAAPRTPVPAPRGNGNTTGAGTPDPAPVVARRVRVVGSAHGRHGSVA